MKPTSAVAWPIVAFLMAFTFLNYLSRVSVTDAGEQIRAKYEFSDTTFGMFITANLAAYTVCMLPGGWLSDRYGARAALTVMGIGVAVFAALTGVIGLTIPGHFALTAMVMLLISRAAIGAFTAPLFPAAGRVVTNWISFGKRARVNAMIVSAAFLGGAFSHPICGALIDAFSWPAAILLVAMCMAMLALVWMVWGRDAPSGKETEKPLAATLDDQIMAMPRVASWRSILTNRSLWLLTIGYATVGYVENLIIYWSGDYFKRMLDLGEWGERIAAMAPLLCMAICVPLGGLLCDWLMPRIGYRRCRATVAMGGMIGSATFLFLGTLVEFDLAIVACFSLSLAMMGLAEAPAWATAIDLGGHRSASSAGFANTGGNLGGLISPTLAPLMSAKLMSQFQLSEQAGWNWALRFAVLLCLLGSVLWIWIDAGERK